MTNKKSLHDICLRCKWVKANPWAPEGVESFLCAWTPPFPIAEPWSREHVSTTLCYSEEYDTMYFREDRRMFRTCGAWERKDQDA